MCDGLAGFVSQSCAWTCCECEELRVNIVPYVQVGELAGGYLDVCCNNAHSMIGDRPWWAAKHRSGTLRGYVCIA